MTDVLLFSMSGIFNKSTKDFIEDIKINKGFNNYHKYRVDPNATVKSNDWVIVVGVEGSLTQHGRPFQINSVKGNTVWVKSGMMFTTGNVTEVEAEWFNQRKIDLVN